MPICQYNNLTYWQTNQSSKDLNLKFVVSILKKMLDYSHFPLGSSPRPECKQIFMSPALLEVLP